MSKLSYSSYFFVGIAGTGMSALAQYAKGLGCKVAGSDRLFDNPSNVDTKSKLLAEGIDCYPQNASGIDATTKCLVVSTAIESSNIEIQKANQLHIPIITRSQLLAEIGGTKKTIAIAGTSGKSTTSAMLFDILQYVNYDASIISGAGLTRLIKQNKIGNAYVGSGEWLVIEADESDGSIINYQPEIGVLLNVEKDHKEVEELIELFKIFKKNTKNKFIVNASNSIAASFTEDNKVNFSCTNGAAFYQSKNYKQVGASIYFEVLDVKFCIHTIGKHNMENALAAIATACILGVTVQQCANALLQYEGIYRRNQIIGKKNGITLIDDYAHNPAKVAAALSSAQAFSDHVVAWFQPHGFEPTRFLRHEFVNEIASVMRPSDVFFMSEIYYAGGTVAKTISANDLIYDLKSKGVRAIYVENRDNLVAAAKIYLVENSVFLLMGARDPSLESYASAVFSQL